MKSINAQLRIRNYYVGQKLTYRGIKGYYTILQVKTDCCRVAIPGHNGTSGIEYDYDTLARFDKYHDIDQ